MKMYKFFFMNRFCFLFLVQKFIFDHKKNFHARDHYNA
jgi:hypothetical protein